MLVLYARGIQELCGEIPWITGAMLQTSISIEGYAVLRHMLCLQVALEMHNWGRPNTYNMVRESSFFRLALAGVDAKFVQE